MATETELTEAETPEEAGHVEPPVLAPLPAPAAPLGPLRPPGRWLRLARELLKGVLLAIVGAVIVALAIAAGIVMVLPPTPPALHLTAARSEVRAHLGTYCWFTPGHARCVDGTVAQRSLPRLKAARGAVLRLSFASPPPTRCTAALTSATTSTVRTLRVLPQRGASGAFQLVAQLPPDTYELDLACRWSPNPSLRSLQGQGDATYSISLQVVSR